MSTQCTQRAARIGLLLGVLGGFTLTGCGTTGLDWVGESELPAPASDSPNMNRPVPARPAGQLASTPIPATTESEEVTESHPRLNHIVTLGEIDVQAPGTPPAANGTNGVSVTINNYTVTGAPGYGYGYGYSGVGVGYGRTVGSFGASGSAARSAASGPQAGQSWPAVADHGSSFPYRSAPASPWGRAQ